MIDIFTIGIGLGIIVLVIAIAATYIGALKADIGDLKDEIREADEQIAKMNSAQPGPGWVHIERSEGRIYLNGKPASPDKRLDSI